MRPSPVFSFNPRASAVDVEGDRDGRQDECDCGIFLLPTFEFDPEIEGLGHGEPRTKGVWVGSRLRGTGLCPCPTPILARSLAIRTSDPAAEESRTRPRPGSPLALADLAVRPQVETLKTAGPTSRGGYSWARSVRNQGHPARRVMKYYTVTHALRHGTAWYLPVFPDDG